MSGVIIGVKDDKIISRLPSTSTPKPDTNTYYENAMEHLPEECEDLPEDQS